MPPVALIREPEWAGAFSICRLLMMTVKWEFTKCNRLYVSNFKFDLRPLVLALNRKAEIDTAGYTENKSCFLIAKLLLVFTTIASQENLPKFDHMFCVYISYFFY